MNTFNCSEAKGWLVSYWSLTSRPLHRTNNTFSILLHHFLSTSLQITSPKLGHSSGKSTQFHQSRKAQRIVTSAADKCSVISSSTPKISYAVTVTFHSVLPLHGKTCTYNFACGLLATKIQLADMRCSTPMCTESLLMQLAPTSGICSGEEEKRKKRKRKKKPVVTALSWCICALCAARNTTWSIPVAGVHCLLLCLTTKRYSALVSAVPVCLTRNQWLAIIAQFIE